MKKVIFFSFSKCTASIFLDFFFFTKIIFQNFENEKKILLSLPFFRQNEKKNSLSGI